MNKVTILIVCLIAVCLCSCSESHVFTVSNYKIQKTDKRYALDSFKIVKVVDNRKVKDSVIGIADDDRNPLTIDTPLPKFLQSTFNDLICKDTNKKNVVPVTLYVDEFFSDRSATFFKQCVHNKYSYLFEYPNGSVIKSLRVVDSVSLCGKPSIDKQNRHILLGTIQTSKYFISHVVNEEFDEPDSGFTADTPKRVSKTDSVNLVPTRLFNLRQDVGFNYYQSPFVPSGYMIWYIEMARSPGSKLEYGSGYSFEIIKMQYSNVHGVLVGFSYPFAIRYNLSNDAKGLFLKGMAIPTFGTAGGGAGLILGGRLEETVGYDFGGHFTLSGGVYQQGYFIIPSTTIGDLGFALSVSLRVGGSDAKGR